MIKQYVITVSVLCLCLVLVLSSSASASLFEKRFSEKLPDSSLFKKIVERVYPEVSTPDSSLVGDSAGENIQEVDMVVDEQYSEDTGETGEWIVALNGPDGQTIFEKIINIITVHNGEFGNTLQRVVERVYAPGTSASGVDNAKADVKTVVVEGSGEGSAENVVANVVVTS